MKCKYCNKIIPKDYKSVDGNACPMCDMDIFIALTKGIYQLDSPITLQILEIEGYIEKVESVLQ